MTGTGLQCVLFLSALSLKCLSLQLHLNDPRVYKSSRISMTIISFFFTFININTFIFVWV